MILLFVAFIVFLNKKGCQQNTPELKGVIRPLPGKLFKAI